MPWPTDPEKRALALERHRAAQAARWARPEDRERARQGALKQWSDPEARRRMGEIKRAQYREHPELRAKVSAGHRGTPRTGCARKTTVARRSRLDLIKRLARARAGGTQ